MCRRWVYAADDCGTLLYTTSGGNIVPCPSGGDEDEEEEIVTNPCTITASMTADGLTASCSDQWECKVKVPLPPSYIDVRPYPATLVRWPTALRFSGQGTIEGRVYGGGRRQHAQPEHGAGVPPGHGHRDDHAALPAGLQAARAGDGQLPVGGAESSGGGRGPAGG